MSESVTKIQHMQTNKHVYTDNDEDGLTLGGQGGFCLNNEQVVEGVLTDGKLINEGQQKIRHEKYDKGRPEGK